MTYLARAACGRLFTALLTDLAGKAIVVQERDKVRLTNHQVALKGQQQELKEKIAATMRQGGLTPPSPKELGEQLGEAEKEIQEILTLLTDAGTIVRLKEGIYYHAEPLSELGRQLVVLLKEKGKISTQDFKSLAGVTRKYAIPLAEYFDAIKITVRVGDDRILRGSGKK